MNVVVESEQSSSEMNGMPAMYDKAVETLKGVNERTRSLIGRQPVAFLLGAAVIGFLVARYARR